LARTARCAGGVGTTVKCALVGVTAITLQEQFRTFTPAYAALGTIILSQDTILLLDATALGRAAAVVGDGGYVTNERDLEAGGIDGAHGGFTTGTGTLDVNADSTHAVFLRLFGGSFGSNLCGERGRLTRAL